MSKIALIIKREYVSRVRKKSFIILTLLTPVFFSAMIFIPVWLATPGGNDEQKSFLVADGTGKYGYVFHDTLNCHFSYTGDTDWQAYNDKEEHAHAAFIVISDDLLTNPGAITVYCREHLSRADRMIVEDLLRQSLKKEKLASFNIPNLEEIIRETEVAVQIQTVDISDTNSIQSKNEEVGFLISIIGATLIYMFIFIYGTQIMHSVLEEKSSRIVEVIIASVKPTVVLAGKIIATMLVAFTQFACWILLTAVVSLFIALFMPEQALGVTPLSMLSGNPLFDSSMLYMAGWYFIYFIFGYLLYSAFFASIGAIIESNADSQQFMLPITIPLIFALYVAISCIQNSEGDLVFWCSLIPFTSPIVMVARLPFHVPVWQLLLSVSLLIAAFILTTKMAAKIYKTGILIYGKKIKYKDIWVWLRNKRTI